MIDADIVIVGAGPAGAALALTLAPRHSVLLVDREPVPRQRIGESLIPAARRLLRDMRILEAFEAEAFPAYLGNSSFWGESDARTTDFLRDPDGPGWHLDRARFEAMLRIAACFRGARLMAPGRLTSLERRGAFWWLSVAAGKGGAATGIRARIVVDASGRSAAVAKRLGIARAHGYRLAACWVRGAVVRETGATAGFSTVESVPGGWWYTAPLSDGARVLAFHTDSDLLPAEYRTPGALAAAAAKLPGIGSVLAETGFRQEMEAALTAANSAALEVTAGERWLAIGDAALSFDPIASRGLFNALYTAWSAAASCHDLLIGDAADFAAYSEDLGQIAAAYRRHLDHVYQAETRWLQAPFWSRRAARDGRAAGQPADVTLLASAL